MRGNSSSRRQVIAGLATAALSGSIVAATASSGVEARAAITRIEAGVGGRLGVAALRVSDGRRIAYRADERFAMCSTFKLLLVGAVLSRVDRGVDRLDRPVAFSADDLLGYAPVTRARVAEGALPLRDLCAAAITVSDNTAANLLLASIGGPPAVTAFARSLGDPVTRLDRNEPTLNTAIPGDPRDTTSPTAMLDDLRALALGEGLSSRSRAQLVKWLVETRTGVARIHAGAPADARVGDKTGTGENGSTDEVAVIWPRLGGPLVVSVYATGSHAPTAAIESAIAMATRAVCRDLLGV
jgi:beta-lactamase class A